MKAGRYVAEWEVKNPAHLESEGGERRVFIPAEECCGQMPWDCECPRICDGENDDGEVCGAVLHGPGSCPDCAGA